MTLAEPVRLRPGAGTRRIAGLDGIRALAVVAVIAAHAHVSWLHGGGVGVDVFFVLSGYLITSLLLAEHEHTGRISLSRFWGRRVLRLLPALLLLLVVVNGIAVVKPWVFGPLGESGIAATPSVLFFFSNWLIVIQNGPALGTFGPLWSLSVEDQFYLIWPVIVVCAFLLRRALRALVIGVVAVCLAVFVYRLIVFEPSHLLRTFGTDFRVDMLLYGCLLAIAFALGRDETIRRWSRRLVIPAVVYLIVVAIFIPEFNRPDVGTIVYLYYTVGIPIVGLASVILIGFVVTHQGALLTRFLQLPPFAYLGRTSYAMYLWHYPIILALQIRFAPDPNVTFLVSLVLTVIAATLSWYLLERPLHRRFHRRFARPTASSIVNGTAP